MDPILRQQAMPFIQLVDGLALNRLTTRYSFMDADEYANLLNRNVGDGMRVYWSETLARAHIASVTAILRSNRWLSAVLSSESDRNALAFAAGLRGLLESAADTTTALIGTPMTLAYYYPTIATALAGLASNVATSPELEDELIHYSHGRYIRKSERADTPQPHIARFTHEYLTIFEKLKTNNVAECYRFLCDLTHPGASSVWMWLNPVNAKDSEFTLSAEPDGGIIASFLERYEPVLLDVLMFAFNAPVLVLNTLNYFPLKGLHTIGLLSHDLDGIPAWKSCQRELEQGGARLQVSAH